MTFPVSIPTLRADIKNAKKVFVYVALAQTAEGTAIGGYIEVYKSHVLDVLKLYSLPTSKHDNSVTARVRKDVDTAYMYIEPAGLAA
jgi:hypothetical protein